MIFTLVIITILSFFIISYSAYSIIQDRNPINKRITTLNNFVTSVEQDLPRHLFISGYRAIFILQKNSLNTNTYITNLEDSFEELFFNGTINGEINDLMTDGKFSSIEYSLNRDASKINANISLSNPKISLDQEDPWNLRFVLNVTILIEDKSNLVIWNRSSSIESYIPINNFLDSIYYIETFGKVSQKINQTPYTTFVSTIVSGPDYTNLASHFSNSYYKASTSAPSFMNRLQGNFSGNQNGIESLVYPQTLIDFGISPKQKSVVDYIYFSSNNPQAYTIPTINNLILDDQDNHLTIYNVSGVAVPI